ncbi:MAG: oligoribonuclease protein, partial [Pseudomonadota bacterium]
MSQANEAHLPPPSPPNEFNLVWIDMEMTGLDPDRDRVIELAAIVTDPNLNVLAEGPVFAIHQSDEVLDGMDAWNKGTHGKSGLIDKVKASSLTEAQAEQQLLDFIGRYVPRSASPLCGNTISQDRRFLVRYMPRLEAWLHYRNLDVSTLKELAKRWKPEV